MLQMSTVLTEWHRASDLARERILVIPRRASRARTHRRYQERIRAERLNLEDLVRVLHDLPQADRLLQLLLPLVARLLGFREHSVQASKATIVVDGAREHESGIGRGLRGLLCACWRCCIPCVRPTKTEDAVPSLGRRVGEVRQRQQVQGNRLSVIVRKALKSRAVRAYPSVDVILGSPILLFRLGHHHCVQGQQDALV